jgi:hypothetical protein
MMRRRPPPSSFVVPLLAACLCAGVVAAQGAGASGAAPAAARPPASPIPVLLISGANNHDWEWTGPSLREILEESGRFTVTMTTEPGKLLADAAELAPFRAFVLDYNGPRWGAAAEANFVAAVRGGTGVTVVHAANNAFRVWIE